VNEFNSPVDMRRQSFKIVLAGAVLRIEMSREHPYRFIVAANQWRRLNRSETRRPRYRAH